MVIPVVIDSDSHGDLNTVLLSCLISCKCPCVWVGMCLIPMPSKEPAEVFRLPYGVVVECTSPDSVMLPVGVVVG